MVKNSRDDKKFSTNGAIFVVQIKVNSTEWQTTPKRFHTKEEAEKEAKVLKLRYPFVAGFRIVTRKEKEKD